MLLLPVPETLPTPVIVLTWEDATPPVTRTHDGRLLLAAGTGAGASGNASLNNSAANALNASASDSKALVPAAGAGAAEDDDEDDDDDVLAGFSGSGVGACLRRLRGAYAADRAVYARWEAINGADAAAEIGRAHV